MPTYELSVIIKALQRPQLSAAVKRCCTNIVEQGGMIRSMENLGLKPLPYKMSSHGTKHYEGNYVLIKFDGSTHLPQLLEEPMKRDSDLIRQTVFADREWVPPCLTEPCHFGEIQNPDHEKNIWWSRVNRRYVRWERRKKENNC
ncbi:28S ribosomal protein S6 [Elysia marginata]|uniref:Small ribosomal subunit protein bS6m n=1 Tax=Elysia marginata TaxID=1093978 RepID=A0AAV4IPA3_9GAST|nr:28S ribosomal protein S6 [Elysia marginata]